MNDWIKRFQNPEAKYRPHPFWSWNGDLSEDELKWQLKEMKRTGHGGFFMHARDGLLTKYMGQEWFKLISAVSAEAERLGLEAWCYDENGWPSGSCGGTIPAQSDLKRVRWIRLLDYNGTTEGVVLRFYGVLPDGTYCTLPCNNDGTPQCSGLGDERIMYASQFTQNDYTDLLNPDTVSDFIRSTHDRYLNNSNKESGSKLIGFFTDEPQYALCRTPWSPIIEEEFMKEYGYSITDNIPSLFLGRDGHEDIRFDFWRLVSCLYTESFAGQIYDWCNEHSCRLTGHCMMEDNLLCQIHCSAGAMPMYEYMHIPGIDWLGRYPPETKDGTPIPTVALQVGSVASQLGRRQVLTESFAMSGHDVSFAEMRYLIEWQMLYGVNLICQHLYPYSVRAERKNDFPPALSHHAPWWEVYGTFNDTMSRLGKIMSEGIDDPGVLMLHPMHSVWLKYTNDDMNAETPLDVSFRNAEILLDSAHIPFHLGDETIMARHGRADGDRLIIGECSYHTVFIPTVFGIDRTTYDLLSQFASAGGRLVLIGDPPEFINGRRAPEELSSLLSHAVRIAPERNNLIRFMKNCGVDTVTISGENCEEKAIRFCRREFPDDKITAYFLLNTDRKHSHRVSVKLDAERAVELRCDSMKCLKCNASPTDSGHITVELNFAPMESHLILTGAGAPKSTVSEPDAAGILDLRRDIPLWRLSPDSDPNCMMIDYCRLGSGGKWSDRMHVWNASRVNNEGMDICYSFCIDEHADLPSLSDMKLVSEFSEKVTLSVNGSTVSNTPGEWWLDHRFPVYAIGDLIKTGENEIVISGADTDGGIGYVYLVGNFGVFPDGGFKENGGSLETVSDTLTIGKRPDEFAVGSIVPQGHPFFAGRLILECDFDVADPDIPLRAIIGAPDAACARISANSVPGELLAWGSFEDDITHRIVRGKNQLKVELWIGLGNLLGPHHVSGAVRYSVGPDDFIPSRLSKWNRNYSFAPAGIRKL